MFLVDSALAAQDWQKVLDEVQRILGRAGAEVVSLKKWDERRLCYDIDGNSRGTYILVYFNCDTSKVRGIERDVQLSEMLARVLILRTDRMSEADMGQPTPLETQAAEEAAAVEAAAETVPAEAEAVAEADATETDPETTEDAPEENA